MTAGVWTRPRTPFIVGVFPYATTNETSRSSLPRRAGARFGADAHAPLPLGERQSNRLRVREQYLDRRSERRRRAPPHEFSGFLREPQALPRRLAGRVQRDVWGQRRRVCRAVGGRRTEAP